MYVMPAMEVQRIVVNGVDYIDIIERGGGTIEIVKLQVNSERGNGLGTTLLDLAERRIVKRPQHLYVITRQSNLKAIKFYESRKFEVLVLLKEFYHEDTVSDALMLGKILR